MQQKMANAEGGEVCHG